MNEIKEIKEIKEIDRKAILFMAELQHGMHGKILHYVQEGDFHKALLCQHLMAQGIPPFQGYLGDLAKLSPEPDEGTEAAVSRLTAEVLTEAGYTVADGDAIMAELQRSLA